MTQRGAAGAPIMGAVTRTRLLAPVAVALSLCGCGDGESDDSGATGGDRPSATVTVTETVTAEPTPDPTGFPEGYRPVQLEVHADGCGVVRNTSPEIEGLQNLGWSVLDPSGFEVLQRNALGESRYRFYQPGTYTVVVTAWDGEKYAPVSNRVDVDC